MVSQPPSDTPFGLEPNLAAAIAYFFGVIGGIVMLVGGGTNRYVKWAAAQAITLWVVIFLAYIAIDIVNVFLGVAHLWALWPIMGIITMLLGLVSLVAWLYTWITALQGKEVVLPIVGDLTKKFFATQLA